jgi:uncharacterized membrane protein
MENLKPNGQRANNAITLIWIVLILEIISLISGYFQYDLLDNASNGIDISIESANANDTRERVIGIIYLIIYLVSAITFIQWFRRAYYNLHLKIDGLTYTEGWAAGAWFTPFINLFRPYQIMKELYQQTTDLLTKKQLNLSQNLTTNLLTIWWTLWIISGILGQFIFRYSMKAESINELIVSTGASMVNNVVGIPLALITIKIIKDYSNIEPLLNEITEVDETLVS